MARGNYSAEQKSFKLEVHPCSGCPLPAQRVLSISGLLSCIWAQPTLWFSPLVTKALHKDPPHPCPQPLWPRDGSKLFLPPSFWLSAALPCHQDHLLQSNSAPREDNHLQLQTGQFSSWVKLLALTFKYFSPNKEQSFPNYEAEAVRGLKWEHPWRLHGF